MGFDNECILQPETVPGEYYCPLCRQLVYPAEAQQAPCGHLFCRPCIIYIFGSSRSCPYDNHPVNETDPKGLQEANPPLYEALSRIAVRCLYNKSGCAWQGHLMDCIAHSSSCPYGSSAVICNRCGVQIMHRQVQEHAQTCTGTAPQAAIQQQQMSVQQPPVVHGSVPMVDNSQLGQAVVAVPQQYSLGQQPGLGAQQIQQGSGAPVPAYMAGQEQQHQQPLMQQQMPQPPQQHQQPVMQQQISQNPPTDQWYYQQQYQQYYQQQVEQYQQYEQYQQFQQLQQQQFHQQQLPAAQTQQFQPPSQQFAPPEPNPQMQPSMHQQVHPQNVGPHPQPHLSHPQSHPMLVHQQQQLQPQSQPQPQPQLQPQPQPQLQAQPQPQQQLQLQVQAQPQQLPQQFQQPQLQQPQLQPQLLQQQQVFPPQHQQQHPSLRPPQQPPHIWEQQQNQQQMGWIQDGKPHMGHVTGQGQALQDLNANLQYGGVPQVMQQPVPAVQQNVPQWQGQTLPGQGMHLAAQQSQAQAFQQVGQPIPNHVFFNQPNQQLPPQQLAGPARPVSLRPSANQLASMPLNQPVSLPGQAAQLTRTKPSLVPQTVSGLPSAPAGGQQPTKSGPAPGTQNAGSLPSPALGMPRQLDHIPDKPVSAQNVGGLSSAALVGPKQVDHVSEKPASSQQQLSARQQLPSPQVQTEPKKAQAHSPHDIKQSSKTSPSVCDESPVPLPGRQQQKGDEQQQEDSASPPQQEKQPSVEPATSKPGTFIQQQVVPPTSQNKQQPPTSQNKQQAPTSQNKQQAPPPQLNGPQNLAKEEEHEKQHQSPGPKQGPGSKQGGNTQIQEAHLSSIPQVASLSTSVGSLQPQQGAKVVPSAPSQNFPPQIAPRPFEPEMPNVPPPWPVRVGSYENQKLTLSGQAGHASQPVFPRGYYNAQHSRRHSDMPANLVDEAQPMTSVSHGVSSLNPSLMNGLSQKGYLEVFKHEVPGGLLRGEGSRSTFIDPSRQNRDRMPLHDDDSRFGKPSDFDNTLRGKSDESFFVDPQQNVQLRSEHTWQQPKILEGNRQGGWPDFPSRLPPNGGANSLNILSRVPPHSSIVPFPTDLELGGRSSFVPEIGAGPTFPSDIGVRHGPAVDVSSRPGAPTDTGTRTRFASESGQHLKAPPDGSQHGLSPERGIRQGPSGETVTRLGLPFELGPRFGLPLDLEPRPRFAMDLEPRPGFAMDREPRPRFSSEVDPRPRFSLDVDLRPRFPLETESRPRLPLEAEPRPRFSSEAEPRPRFSLDIEPRPGFALDGGPRPFFPMDLGSQPHFPGPHQDTMERRPEGIGLRQDFMGGRPELTRGRSDPGVPLSSPGREHTNLPSRIEPDYISGRREMMSLPSHLEGLPPGAALRTGPEMGQDALRFEDPRMKNLGFHPNTLQHDIMNQGRQLHFGMRTHPLSVPGPPIGHMPGHAMVEQGPPNFLSHGPPHGFLNGGLFLKPGQMDENPEPLDHGRKRKQMGSSGWCRICHVDCYTVEGLQKHSQSDEHQKRTLDLVMSIKQDTAKKQKHLADESMSLPENGNKSRRSGGTRPE